MQLARDRTRHRPAGRTTVARVRRPGSIRRYGARMQLMVVTKSPRPAGAFPCPGPGAGGGAFYGTVTHLSMALGCLIGRGTS